MTDIHALTLRQVEQDGEIKMLAAAFTQSSQQTANAMHSMSADIKQMSADIRGMAPHANDISRLGRVLEKVDARLDEHGKRLGESEKRMARWGGGLSVALALFAVVFSTISRSTDKDIAASREVTAMAIRAHTDMLTKLENRIERLEGTN